jgi:hypothetical protein
MRFIDPLPGLRAEYELALGRLREELGEPKTRRERLRFGWKAYRLRRRYLGWVRAISNW